MTYRVDFDSLPWESPMSGVRHKVVVVGDRRLRLVTYTADLALHWCDRGHVGQIIEGQLRLEFAHETVVYGPGDGVTIPSGAAHAHRASALTPTVTALFVEDA